jgi:hypothetical protein
MRAEETKILNTGAMNESVVDYRIESSDGGREKKKV